MTPGNVSFRLDKEEDRTVLRTAAKLAGAGNPSILLRNVVAAMRYMSSDELRTLNTLAAEKEAAGGEPIS